MHPRGVFFFFFFFSEVLDERQLKSIASLLVRNRGRLKDRVEPMMPETEQLLHDFYQPFVRRLAAMIGDDRFLWKDLD